MRLHHLKTECSEALQTPSAHVSVSSFSSLTKSNFPFHIIQRVFQRSIHLSGQPSHPISNPILKPFSTWSHEIIAPFSDFSWNIQLPFIAIPLAFRFHSIAFWFRMHMAGKPISELFWIFTDRRLEREIQFRFLETMQNRAAFLDLSFYQWIATKVDEIRVADAFSHSNNNKNARDAWG